MEDHEPGRERKLARLLRELPREGASSGFTPRVLERLEAEGWQAPRAGQGRPARLALAAAALAAASLGIAIGLLRPPGPPAAGREETVALPAVAGAAKGAASTPRPDAGRLAHSDAAASGPAGRGGLAGSTPAQGRAGAESSDAALAHQLLRELRDESGRLERELRDLRRPQREILYLGGDDELDLVVDLSRVREGRRVLPAAHHHGTL